MGMLKIEKAQALHIQGIRSAFDAVAREGRYFSSSEASALDHFAPWMENNLHGAFPQIVALDGDTVVGWSIVCSNDQPFLRHCGTLFIGLLPGWRGHGIGRRMLAASLEGARGGGLAFCNLLVTCFIAVRPLPSCFRARARPEHAPLTSLSIVSNGVCWSG